MTNSYQADAEARRESRVVRVGISLLRRRRAQGLDANERGPPPFPVSRWHRTDTRAFHVSTRTSAFSALH